MIIFRIDLIEADVATLRAHLAELPRTEVTAHLAPEGERRFDGELSTTLTLMVDALAMQVAEQLAATLLYDLMKAGVKQLRIGLTRHHVPDLKALGEALARHGNQRD